MILLSRFVEQREHIQITKLVHLSYNALLGITNRSSIRFSGTVHGRDIRILMDGAHYKKKLNYRRNLISEILSIDKISLLTDLILH